MQGPRCVGHPPPLRPGRRQDIGSQVEQLQCSRCSRLVSSAHMRCRHYRGSLLFLHAGPDAILYKLGASPSGFLPGRASWIQQALRGPSTSACALGGDGCTCSVSQASEQAITEGLSLLLGLGNPHPFLFVSPAVSQDPTSLRYTRVCGSSA